MSRDSYEILHEHIHGWLHRKNIASSVRRVSALPVAIATDIGLVRKENQDRIAVLKFRPSSKNTDMIVVALADGMGGMEGGANAASLTVSTFFTEIVKNSHLPVHTCLEKAVLRANDAVLNMYKGNGGATLSAIAIDDRENITAINIGDSRIYNIDSGNISQVSEDDTVLALARKYNQVIDGDSLSMDSRFGGELVQFIGLDGVLEIHFHNIKISTNSILILTSDGAHSIGNANLLKISQNASNTGVLTKRVVDLASWFGGFDNATIAAMSLVNLDLALTTSSGDAINLWDPFGEMKIFSVPSGNIISDSVHGSDNMISVGEDKLENHEKNIISTNTVKKNTPKRKPRAKSKSKPKDISQNNVVNSKPNNNEKLESIEQIDIPYPNNDVSQGDENE